MDLLQALTTTGAVRDFSPAPVPDETVYRILEAARFAPSGGNRQAWRLVLVKDRDKRRRLRDLYLVGWYEYLAARAAGLTPWAPLTDRDREVQAMARAAEMKPPAGDPGGMAENLDRVPVLLVLLADLRGLAAVDRDADRYTMVGGASVYPFAWSILLAAHEAGLGGVITTMLVRSEPEVLDLLGVPEGWALAAALALGFPAGPRPTRLRRAGPEQFTTVDGFDGPELGRPTIVV
ncbi:MAG TPA: nitroreductase family protein [Acidimicrobiales bacterium]|nr:nitroreductase family protein [Acidimicrobiales bacterium]